MEFGFDVFDGATLGVLDAVHDVLQSLLDVAAVRQQFVDVRRYEHNHAARSLQTADHKEPASGAKSDSN